MNKTEKFNEKELGINPFTVALRIPVTKVISNVEFVQDISDGIFHNKAFFLEKVKKTSIYHCESCRDNTIGLTDKALRLYMWILMSIEPNKDYIQINQEYYMKKSGTKSINTFKAAITELSRYLYISAVPGFKSIYWINPMFYYSGNRLNKYPSNIEETGQWEK